MPTPQIKKKATPSSKGDTRQTTIGQYLLDRLQQHGVAHIFGIPGDYILKFDKLIEQQKGIQFINATRENTAGYMADAYARLRGLGVACITYGVGINIANALSQALVENSPLVVISGAAGTDAYLKGIKLHHLIDKALTDAADTTQLSIFKHLTVAQAVLNDPATAAAQIDKALALCLDKKKPIYIEIPSNMVDCPITITNRPKVTKAQNSPPVALEEAMEEIARLLKTCHRPILWIGHEIQRFGLGTQVTALAEKYHIPIVSSLLGKTAIDEHHRLFAGVYQGKMSHPDVQALMESRDCVFMLGLMLTDIDTGIFTAKLDHEHKVNASIDALEIGKRHYAGVALPTLLQKMVEMDAKINFAGSYPAARHAKRTAFKPVAHAKTSTKRVFECIQQHLPPNAVVIADVGDSLFASADLVLPQDAFLSCAHFGSLGFATPGCIGAQLAAPDKRIIAIVGDGAFQISSMELSAAVRYHLDPVVIVLNNHGYGTERPLLEGSYNDIQNWNYTAIPSVVGGGVGIKASTEEELDHALKTALGQRGTFYLIEVELAKTDFSPALTRFGALASQELLPKRVGKVGDNDQFGTDFGAQHLLDI